MNRYPPKRVIVAADLSATSLAALDAAKFLARLWGATLEIVYVHLPPTLDAWGGPGGFPSVPPPPDTPPLEEVESRLRRAVADFSAARLTMSAPRGWPTACLLDLARHERTDFLVMGAHGHSGLHRLLTGSVAETVIRRARVPVLAVPEKTSVAATLRVLAPWNGRPYATRALRWAREFARGMGATLDVLHVKEGGLAVGRDAVMLRRSLLAILGPETDWTLSARVGDARARIVALANSGRCGLVVLSAHRRPFGADLALGSTIERVLRHAHVPVLAVPSGRPLPGLLRRVAARAGTRLY
ncbi:MAG: universal stress protein [Elusimicrobia bacterium]|nr:universal stress protein [Elusimicrobiota bacterium]